MPTISELTDKELLIKYDKVEDYLLLLKKEMKRRGLRKTFMEKLASVLDAEDLEVTRPSTSDASSIKTHISKKKTRVYVSSSSDEDAALKKPKPKSKIKIKTVSAKPKAKPKPEKPQKKRAVEKATIPEIKTVLTRNGVKFKSKDNKATLLEIARNNNLIRTIEYYREKNQ